jgi:dienelactone hydrolase
MKAHTPAALRRSSSALFASILPSARAALLGAVSLVTAHSASAASFAVYNYVVYDSTNPADVDLYGKLQIPDAYASNPTQLYPLVIAYHGAGEGFNASNPNDSRNNTDQVKSNGPTGQLLARGASSTLSNGSFFVYAPQTTGGSDMESASWTYWEMEATMKVAARIMKDYPIDPTRVYITGLSAGGKAAWMGYSNYTDVLAGAVLVCGVPGTAGTEVNVSALVGQPIWAFHARNDSVLNVSNSRNRMNAIRTADGKTAWSWPSSGDPTANYEENELKYRDLASGGHGIWNTVYSDNAVYAWMASKSRPISDLEEGETLLFDLGNVRFAKYGKSVVDDQGRFWNSTEGTGAERTFGPQVPFAMTSQGHNTRVTLEVTEKFDNIANTTGTSSLPYPLNIGKDSWYNHTSHTAQMTLTGLVPGASYAFKFFATYHDDDGGRGRSTRYKALDGIGGVLAYDDLEVALNTNNVAEFTVAADSNGEILLEVGPTPGTTSRTSYIGVMEVHRVASQGIDAVYAQNFDGSTNLNTYFADPNPDPSQVNDISPASYWSISSGKLRQTRTTSSTAASGFMRIREAGVLPEAAVMSFDLTISGSYSVWNDLAQLDIGDMPTLATNYGSNISSTLVANRIHIKGNGPGKFRFHMNGVTATPDFPVDVPVKVTWASNYSGSTVTYDSPTGPRNLADGLSDLWITSGTTHTLLFDAVGRTYSKNVVGSFRLRSPANLNFTMDWDNIELREIQ